MIKFGEVYQQALQELGPGSVPGKHLSPTFAEWLHGLPPNWTAADADVAPLRLEAPPCLQGISMPAA